MIYLVITGAATLMLLGYAMAKVAGDTDDYDELVRQRMERDKELRSWYWAFYKAEGRPPTTRELWELSPPEVNDEE